MPYQIELAGDGKTLVVSFRGLVDADAARDCRSDLLTYVKLEDTKYRFLLDFSAASGLTDESKDLIVSLARKIKESNQRFAVISSASLMMVTTQMFEGQSGLSSVRIFTRKEEAVQWLWSD